MADDFSDAPRAREPIFNIPWPVVILALSIVGGYAVQSLFPQEVVEATLGFVPAFLAERPQTLLSAILIHASWSHALVNALTGVVFCTPVARALGLSLRGAGVLLLFYSGCGVLANLGYAGIHPEGLLPLVGASGAISGLLGGTARLMGGLDRIVSAPVIALGAAAAISSLVLSAAPVAGGDSGVAWEGHIAGFLAGVLLIGPAARLARG